MSANMRKIMGEVPRPMEIAAHDDRDSIPMGRKKLSPTERTDRTQQYLAGLADGTIPLDDDSAQVLKEYLDAHHARQ